MSFHSSSSEWHRPTPQCSPDFVTFAGRETKILIGIEMRPFDEQSPSSLSFEENRLETPAMVGYRTGMSSSGVIGRKLCSVFGVERDLPEEMGSALRQLNSRLGRAR